MEDTVLLLYFSPQVSSPTAIFNCLPKVPSILHRIRCYVLSAHAVQTTLTLTYSSVV
jgi:hypothetical protein